MASWNMNYYNTGVTVELGQLVDMGVDPWAFEYPSYYKGEEKKAFEQKVIDHYRFRQIGQETPARFLHYFRTRIKEVMPYYIQLYKSQELMQAIEDPFGNVDIVETFEQETTGTSSGTSSTTNSGTASHDKTADNTRTENHTRKFSNTPQGSISNLDNYMTEANVETANDGDTSTEHVGSESSATSEGTATGSESGTVKHTLTRKGNQGVNTYAHDMKELRETFLNIDMMIINELKDLFLMVY